MSDLNLAAVKRHALACSSKHRGGRFDRVGESFLTELDVDVEQMLREIRNKHITTVNPPLDTGENFITPALLERIRVEINAAIARLIQSKVARQPSCGKTLSRTR